MSMEISTSQRSRNTKKARRDYFRGACKLLIDPKGFYASMPSNAKEHSNSIASPMALVILYGLISAAICFSYHKFGISNLCLFTEQMNIFVYYPVMMLLTSFIVTMIMFLLWQLLGSKQDFVTAYWCVAYAHIAFPIAMLASFFPYLGNVLGIVTSCLLLAIASVQVHKIRARLAAPIFVVFAFNLLTYGLQSDYALQHIDERAKKFAT